MRSSSSVTVGKIALTSSFSATYSPHCTGTPISLRLSRRRTFRPRREANRAAELPAGPAPTTTTSYGTAHPPASDVAGEDVVHELQEARLRLALRARVERLLREEAVVARIDPRPLAGAGV